MGKLWLLLSAKQILIPYKVNDIVWVDMYVCMLLSVTLEREKIKEREMGKSLGDHLLYVVSIISST